MAPDEKELQLINMVQRVQAAQAEYFALKKRGYAGTNQLDICKQLERGLKDYVTKRKKEIESKQQQLFT